MQAIAIVLLPPKEIMDLAITLNKKLEPKEENEITLGHENYLPHITLLHACTRDAGQLAKRIKPTKPLQLEIVELTLRRRAENKTTALKIKLTEELVNLKKEIISNTRHLLFQTATQEMFAEKVNDLTIDWVNSYPLDSTFYPHITVGFGYTEPPKLPITFTADTIALCHLGKYNTCYKVLALSQSTSKYFL